MKIQSGLVSGQVLQRLGQAGATANVVGEGAQRYRPGLESPDICHNGGAQCSREDGERLRRIATKGTGVGIFFAREMMVKTGVPQGLICTAQGGTSMPQWSPAGKAEGPASLYASMLASVAATGQPVAGVLWYQGESDASAAEASPYTARMEELVRSTRRDLRQPRVPWVVVQLARTFENPFPV